jgi:hypothetical protein
MAYQSYPFYIINDLTLDLEPLASFAAQIEYTLRHYQDRPADEDEGGGPFTPSEIMQTYYSEEERFAWMPSDYLMRQFATWTAKLNFREFREMADIMEQYAQGFQRRRITDQAESTPWPRVRCWAKLSIAIR